MASKVKMVTKKPSTTKKPKAKVKPKAKNLSEKLKASVKKTTNKKTGKTTKTTPVTKNRIAIVVDKSGSMDNNRKGVVALYNNTMATLKKNSKKGDQETEVSLFYFNTEVEEALVNRKAEALKTLTMDDYHPAGGTALFDATVHAIRKIEKTGSKDTAHAVIVLTDGEERDSMAYRDPAKFRKLLQEKIATDLWTLAFMVPKGMKANFLKLSGLSEGNVTEWADIKNADKAASDGLSKYYIDRRAGATSSKSFFTTDLSKVKKTDLRKLDDVSDEFRFLNVEQECEIRDFVESKGLVYTKGCASYQLTKNEEVQDYKEVYLVKKGTKTVLSGGRGVLGMPTTGTLKLIPGNHADYDIFITSTSTNRKLVRGTKVLYKK